MPAPSSVSLLLAGLLFAGSAFALDPNLPVSRYLRDHWDSEQGFPRGPVYSIGQTADGYLWIGTGTGLLRFDGMAFRAIKNAPGGPPVAGVAELTADRDGCLWLRLEDLKLLRYCDGAFTNPSSTSPNADSTHASALSRTSRGDILIAQPAKGALVLRQGSFAMLAGAGELSRTPVTSVAQTPSGAVWMGTREAGVFRFAEGGASPTLNGLRNTKINCLVADGDRNLWIGTDDGLFHWNGAEFVAADVPPALRRFQVLSMMKDREGNLWVGTDSRGLLRVNARGVAVWNQAGSDRNDGKQTGITALFEDREGELWIGSANGLTRLRDSTFIDFPLPEGRSADGGSPVFVDAQNRVWTAAAKGGLWDAQHGHIAAGLLNNDVVYSITGDNGGLWLGSQRGGLTRLSFDRGSFKSRSYAEADGLAQNSVFSVYETRDGAVWAGTLSGGASELRQGKFTTWTLADGLASNTISAILETRDGTIWFATPSGLTALSHGRTKTFTRREGLPSPNVNCLMEDSAGILWAGTAEGLAFSDSRGFRTPAAGPSVLRESVLGMAEDHSGGLWLSTSGHVLRVARERLISGGLSDSDIREFGPADGLRGGEGVKRNRSVFTDPLGRIWFSRTGGISFVDPARLNRNSVRPIVHLLSILADGNAITPGKSVRIPGGSSRIDFGFLGLMLRSPQSVRFRYRLDGFDRGWSPWSGTPAASYTNLSPGEYHFRVVAGTPESGWSAEEATVTLQVDALFWQTWWFVVCLALASVAAVSAVYRMRLRAITRQLNARFDERLSERTRLARDLHDTLLQTIQGSKMVADDGLEDPADLARAYRALERVAKWLGQATEEGRAALAALRSTLTQQNDLAAAFRCAGADCVFNTQIHFELTLHGQARDLHPIVRDEIYRIGYEAIRNACRHSQGTKVSVELIYSRDLTLRVRDNGIGIAPELIARGKEGHYGIKGMTERAGHIGARLQFNSTKSGTEVELVVPGNLTYKPS